MIKGFSIAVLALLLSNGAFANDSAKNDIAEVMQTGEKVVSEVAGFMMKELKKQLSDGNLSKSFHFCSSNAMIMTADMNKKYAPNISVKRVTLNNRNPINKPTDEAEKAVLKAYELLSSQHIELPSMVKKVDDSSYKYFKPIKIVGEMCLKCHGDTKNMSSELKSDIAKIYPEDKAVGYKVGDFRGMFVVDIKKGGK